MPGDEERAALQAKLCELIRDVPAHAWTYRVERAMEAARFGNVPFSAGEEIMWAAIAAVAHCPALLDAVHQVAQVDRFEADACIPLPTTASQCICDECTDGNPHEGERFCSAFCVACPVHGREPFNGINPLLTKAGR